MKTMNLKGFNIKSNSVMDIKIIGRLGDQTKEVLKDIMFFPPAKPKK